MAINRDERVVVDVFFGLIKSAGLGNFMETNHGGFQSLLSKTQEIQVPIDA